MANQVMKSRIDDLHNPVVITDSKGSICYANRAQVNSTGYSFAEMYGKRPGDLWGGHMPANYYVRMWDEISKGSQFIGCVVNTKKSSAQYTDKLVITPITDSNKPIYYVQAVDLFAQNLRLEDVAFLSESSQNSFSDRIADFELLNKAKEDLRNFSLIFEKYNRKLFAYLLPRTNFDHNLAEDIVQETFSRAIRYIDSYSTASASYLTYLIKIAHTVLVRHHEKSSKYKIVPELEEDGAVLNSGKSIETHEILVKGLSILSEVERRIVISYHIDGYSLHEISIMLGKTENAVKLLLSRARKKMRIFLEK